MKSIDFCYTEDGITYQGSIDREYFYDQMSHMVKWFPSCNQNATKLCELIPKLRSITINKSVVDTRDVPFIEVYCFDSDIPQIVELRRPYTIIWDFLLHYCQDVKNQATSNVS